MKNMKHMKYLNKTSLVIITALIMSLGFTSCEEDFLDVPPTNAGDSSTAIGTVADAKVMLSGIMRRMTDLTYYGRNFMVYAEAKGGEVTTRTLGRGLSDMYTFNSTPTSNTFEEFWNGMYNRILQTNYLIESIDKVQGEGNFNDIKGQALTLRAILYFDLVRIYGKPYTFDKASYGVPNILTPIDALEQPLRASVEDNYKQIMIDLLAAESLLSKSKNNGYLNYYANKAMQARVYLSMANYPQALAAAQEVINSGTYQLYSNSAWVDSWTKQFGSESIFELGIVPNENDHGNGSLSIYFRKQLYGSSSANGQYFASDYYIARLGQDASDVRWGIMGDDREFASEAIHLGASYKYSGNTLLAGDGKSTPTAVNIKVIRLSEVYLIAAEAAFHSDKDLAADYLNAIRKRAPNLAPATAGTISIDMILDEKSKELFTEGQRYFDMLRLGKPITFNDDFNDLPIIARPKTIDLTFNKIVLPIPKNEINANPGLGAQQNPGY
ncbi:RagB/SusD family nutrient uptake outer membrane protein [Gelidibacter sp.]|uniref:RagB/SusD family nutrient uptake outer membrane protein n=2 Tax=Gelidibacter sp. TaxID=2018083 RepID=UPI00326702DA